MQPKPTFLFAFANDDSHSLSLDNEWRQTEKALALAEDAGKLRFNLTPSATKEDLWNKFNRFHHHIALFHYGGHSSSRGINLTDTELNGTNLATLIGQEAFLKLVFLNGCSNVAQVQVLFDQGVPLVIATSGPVVDRNAIDFSRQFYEALAAGRTIEDAFAVAAAYVNHQENGELFAHRGIASRKTQELEWGLYVNDAEALQWRIPETPSEGAEDSASSRITHQKADKIYNIDRIDKADFS